MDVLILDDIKTNVTLLSFLIKSMGGTRPVTFTSPTDALAWSAENDPDLILVDYMMPDVDGIEFIRRFRAITGRENTPIIMVTADTERDVRHRALKAGANDFLTKPVDRMELLARARNMLALRRHEVELAGRAEWLADEVKKATREIRAREREVVHRLSKAAEFRDPETGAHLLRMANYSRIIAGKLGLSELRQDIILEAAPMHDIGKVGTPDHILLKPGRLDDGEMEIMRRHAEIGAQILARSDSPLLQAAAEIAWTHHEKWDGTGYPRGLAGEAIPLHGRIVAVADVFDALTSARPYKPAWEIDRATRLLRESAGGHFDPTCVDAFFASWEEVLDIRDRFQDERLEDL
jgi:putative two-component system response regulator